MSETTGYVDEQGAFNLKVIFDPRNPGDIEEMSKLLNAEEATATVKDYGPNFVEVIYRPDRLSEYGF